MSRRRHDKYSTEGLPENENEPGGEAGVLRNKLGIRTIKEIEKVETESFKRIQEYYWNKFSADIPKKLTESIIKGIHKDWLGGIYEWAGEYRQVKMSKGNCPFTFPEYIPREMEKFENELLNKKTPLQKGSDIDDLSDVIAEVHGQFEIIHPFRDGNGRIGRLIAELMALQAGYPPLNYERLAKHYIDAMEKLCIEGDPIPLRNIIKKAIELGIRKAK